MAKRINELVRRKREREYYEEMKMIFVYLKDGTFFGIGLESRGVEAEDEEIARLLKKRNIEPEEIESMEEDESDENEFDEDSEGDEIDE